jgi:flavin reductase (DIM6/NTAB) family NADH-FMN oxidoreductase RutF
MGDRPVAAPPLEFDLPVHGGFAPVGIGETFPDDAAEDELEIAGEPGQDPAAAFRRTLGMFATGVTVVTTQAGDQVHGMTANAFMSVSLEPPLVLISVDRRTKMCALLHEGMHYGVSVLCESQAALSDRFAGRSDQVEPRFQVVKDTPLVDGALAHFVARVEKSYWGGDHSLFLGRVEYARQNPGTPLLFHGGRYEKLGA